MKTSLKQQLIELESQVSKAKKKKDIESLKKQIYYLKIKVAREAAYKKLKEGDTVGFQEKTGTIVGKYIANGGLPCLWVQWDADPERKDKKGIILPEDPLLMTLLKSPCVETA